MIRVYYNSSIHSTVYGDLGCVQFGAIMNKADMLNLLRHNYSFLLDIYQGIQSLGSRICICSALMNFVKQFSKTTVSIYTSFSNV